MLVRTTVTPNELVAAALRETVLLLQPPRLQVVIVGLRTVSVTPVLFVRLVHTAEAVVAAVVRISAPTEAAATPWRGELQLQ